MNKSFQARAKGAQRVLAYLKQEAVAAREGFRNYKEKVLSIPAFRAHPGWNELRDELLVAGDLVVKKAGSKSWHEADTVRVNGQIFVRTDRKAPAAVSAVVRWFRRNHPREAKQILEEESA
jgi:hypothetical protein